MIMIRRTMTAVMAAFLAAVFACFLLVCSVAAEEGGNGFADEYYRLMDTGELLSDSEESELLASLDELSERQKLEVVIATVESLEGSDIAAYADDMYDYCHFGYGPDKDGVMLLVSEKDRSWHISTCGYGITAFTDAGISYIGRQMKPDLSAGNYAGAFRTYIDQCDAFITQARTGRPYDRSSLPKGNMPVTWLLISLGVGLVLAFVTMAGMKAKMKTVRYEAQADNYIRDGSMNITRRMDMYLYSTVEKTARQKENDSGSSTHTSSSGNTHGGGGGSF
jgi:uncharacterized protein